MATTKYRAPRGVKIGDRLQSIHGPRVVTHLVPTAVGLWPASATDRDGKRMGCRHPPLVVYGDLLAAIKIELVGTVCELWGVGRKVAARWAREVGVDTRRSPALVVRRRALAAAGVALPGDARKRGAQARNAQRGARSLTQSQRRRRVRRDS